MLQLDFVLIDTKLWCSDLGTRTEDPPTGGDEGAFQSRNHYENISHIPDTTNSAVSSQQSGTRNPEPETRNLFIHQPSHLFCFHMNNPMLNLPTLQVELKHVYEIYQAEIYCFDGHCSFQH